MSVKRLSFHNPAGELIEADVEFPVFRKTTTDFGEGRLFNVVTRWDENGVEVSAVDDRVRGHSRSKGVNVTRRLVTPEHTLDVDFVRGVGKYASSESEFVTAMQKVEFWVNDAMFGAWNDADKWAKSQHQI